MRQSLRATLVLTACACVLPGEAAAQDPGPLPRPDAIQQPIDDGCQRNPAGLLTFSSPEWVFVYSDETFNPDPARARLLEGVTPAADVAAGDLPQNHDFYDFNADVRLDPEYGYLAGGDPGDPGADPPVPPTGNFGEAGPEPTLHIEWELGTLPAYAWPSAGDRLKIWGSWVWDCGHWGQGFTADPNDPAGTVINDTDYFLPGTNQTGGLRGEGTEFHPWQGAGITRENPYEPAVQETQTDVFISTDATTAYSESVCSRRHPAPAVPDGAPPLPYPPEWTACVADPATARQPANDRDYTFLIPAPPQPTPEANLRYRVVEHPSPGDGPEEQVAVLADGIQVTVPFKGLGNSTEPLSFAKSFFVGWTGEDQFRPAQMEVKLKRLTVHKSLDGPEFGTSLGVPPGEWGLYLDVNGFWKFLNEWAPGLDAVNDGQAFDLDRTLDIRVPAGRELRLEIDGRECDLPKIKPCPVTSEVAEDNDLPGTAIDSYASSTAAIGDHVLKPPGDDPRYELTYTVREVSPASDPGGGGGGCADVFVPRSRIGASAPKRGGAPANGVEASSDRIAVHGRARDRTCAGPKRKVAEVDVSVALKRSGECRYAKPSGKLRPPSPCDDPVFLDARGRRRFRLSLGGSSPDGHYLARSRATDRAGNVETARRKRNRERFHVG